jgi:two-component system sensor histidine kinase KdpD
MPSTFGFLLSAEPPSRRTGAIVAVGAVALCTLVLYPLAQIAPVVSLGVVYLLAVLVVSVIWGAWLGFATAVLSAAAFNFFHLPPVGQFTIQSSSNLVALVAFLVAAALASSVAEVTRARARETEERRREADLAAEMARLLLRGENLTEALPTAAARLARRVGSRRDGPERRSAHRRGPPRSRHWSVLCSARELVADSSSACRADGLDHTPLVV